MIAKQARLFILGGLTVAVASCSGGAPAPRSAAAPPAAAVANIPANTPDFNGIAEKIAGPIVGVKERDLVVVRGDVRDIDLIEEITLAVSRRGANALQRVEREAAQRRYYEEVPARYDALRGLLDARLVDIFDVEIVVEREEDPSRFKDVAPARIATVANSLIAINQAKMKRGVRRVYLGNWLYPTTAMAKMYALTMEQLTATFWGGVNVDYVALQATGEVVRSALASGKEVRITHPNGTDLKVSIEARPASVSDGVISAEDVKKGGLATEVWLPAGEVYVTPVPGTAEGKLVIDQTFYTGEDINDLTIVFKAGKAESLTARPSPAFERFMVAYEAADAGKKDFAIIDLGINPNVKDVPGSKLRAWMAAGTISMGIGENSWAGGSNTVPFGAFWHLLGATLTVDGKPLVKDGSLAVSGSKG